MEVGTASTNVDMSTFLWVAAVMFSIIGGLVGLVWKIAWDAIKDLRAKNEALVVKLSDRTGTLHEKLDIKFTTLESKVEIEREARVKAHNDTTQRIFSDIEKLRDRADEEIGEVKSSVGDLRETVAGFGSIYVTRKEWIDERKG